MIDKILANPDYGIRLLTELKLEREQRLLLEAKTESLQRELDESKEWYTIKRVAFMNKMDWRRFNWRTLKEISISMNIPIKKIFDANYGQVNLYHKKVFMAVYPGLRYR